MRTEDGHIIQKCLDGDAAAFGLLVDKYKGSVYALAYAKLGDFHDAQDMTQEVFLKAYRKLRTLKRWDRFLSWLYAITSNSCKDFLRSKANRPDEEYISDQEQECLAKDFNRLPSRGGAPSNAPGRLIRVARDTPASLIAPLLGRTELQRDCTVSWSLPSCDYHATQPRPR